MARLATYGDGPMLEIRGPRYACCDGVHRRGFLKAGFLGLAGLTLADHLRLQAAGRATKDTAVILFWMGGGPSHIDMYDLKPAAPAEFRGEFKPIATNVPGIEVGEHLPLQARQMDKMAVVRSVTHTNPGHGAASHWMQTGYNTGSEQGNQFPSLGSVVAKVRGANHPGVPPYVSVPGNTGHGDAAYLGAAYNPFTPEADPNSPGFKVRNLQRGMQVDLDALRHPPPHVGKDRPGAPRPGPGRQRRRAWITSTAAPSRSSPARAAARRSTSTRSLPRSASATAGTPGATAPCWPAAWWKRA